MKQIIISSNEVQRYLEDGIEILGRLLQETYGPLGKNILFDEKKKLGPDLFKNGSKITRLLRTKNEKENLIFLLLEDSFQKINSLSGDGTKTFFLITSFIILRGFKNLIQNNDRAEISAGIKKTINYAIQTLTDKSQPISSTNFWNKILERYLPNENNISSMFQEAYGKVGKFGQITIQDEVGVTNQLIIQRGMQIPRGYFSPYFITDSQKMSVHFDKPFLLITSLKISLEDGILLQILEQLIYEKRPCLIISSDIEEAALSTLILNKINGVLDLAYIKIPEDFNSQKVILEDLAFYTNAKLIKSEREWRNLKYSDLGVAEKITITKTKTTVWATTRLDEDAIEKKCQELKQQILLSDSDYENEKKEERRKNFQGSHAFITIGGLTELETKNLKWRSELGFTGAKSCLYEGVLPAGGTSLVHLTEEVETWSRINLYGSSLAGSKIVINALLSPVKILINSKNQTTNLLPTTSQLFERLKKGNSFYTSYNLSTDEVTDMFESGLIDSFKSLKISLQTCKSLTTSILSIAKLIL